MKLLTYNAALLKVPDWLQRRAGTPPFVREREAALPSALREIDADIVALQEVFGMRTRAKLCQAVASVYPHTAEPASHIWPIFDSGLLILSKFPISTHSFHPFEQAPWDEAVLCRRGFLAAEILSPLGIILVVTYHTVAGADPESPRMEEFRADQIRQIIAFAMDHHHEPTFLMGDLNAGFGVSSTDRDQSVEVSKWNYDLISEFHHLPATETEFINLLDMTAHAYKERDLITWDSQGILSSSGVHSFQNPQRIDHIFANSTARKLITSVRVCHVLGDATVAIQDHPCVPVSDHVGVLATFKSDLGMNDGRTTIQP